MKSADKIVALVFPPHIAYSRGVTQGVIDRHLESRGWMLINMPRFDAGRSPLPDGDFHLDGAIVWAEPRDLYVQELVDRGVPVVNCGLEWGGVKGVVRVSPKPLDVNQAVVDHFTSLGLERMLILGHKLDKRPATTVVLNHLASVGRAAQMEVEIYDIGGEEGPGASPRRLLNYAHEDELIAKLMAYPKPAAVFCSGDYMGYMVCAVARHCGLRVPEDLAIMGGGGEIVGELSHPPLTSVLSSTRELGRVAAEVLEDWLEHGQPTTHHIEVGGAEIIERESTVGRSGRLALAAVHRFIEEHAVRGIALDELVTVAGMSAKTLNQQYVAAFGVKPLDEANRLRIAAAKALLQSETLSVADVAKRCGFSSQAAFYNYYARHTGDKPSNQKRSRNEEL